MNRPTRVRIAGNSEHQAKSASGGRSAAAGRATGRVPRSTATERPAPARPARPRALVVDDDPLVRRSIWRQLAPGFEVQQASSEAGALAILDQLAARRPPGEFQLAFVDYELPDGTGLPILERLSVWPDGIRILMSGNLERLAKFRACGRLVPLVLTKPLSFESIEAGKRAALKIFEEKNRHSGD